MALDSTKVLVGKLVSDSVKIDDTAVGHVSGGVTISKENTIIDLQSDYSTTKIGSEQTESKYIIELNLTEHDMDAWMYALGQPSSNKTGSTAILGDDTKPSEVTLEFKIDGGTSHPDSILYFYKCDYNSGGAMQVQKGTQLVFPVRFEASINDASKIFYIYQIS
jgi:hypothetical protein